MSATKEAVAAKETITAKMARWAAALEFNHLSQDAVYQAKRFLLDSVGCALGGYQQHDVKIALQVIDEIAGRGPATVIGTGKKIDPVSASFANALMIRCMDYNDIYWKQDPSHPSDIFPAALACCERAKSDGRELIVGLVLGHEFEMRFCEAAFPGIRERGWHHATLTAFVSPLVAGRALHLSWEQIQHAVGISASRHCTLGAVTAGKLTMMKNTVDPMATQSGVLADKDERFEAGPGGKSPDSFACAGGRYSLRSEQVRSPYERDGRPFFAVRDCGGDRRPPSDSCAIRDEKDYGPGDSGAVEKG